MKKLLFTFIALLLLFGVAGAQDRTMNFPFGIETSRIYERGDIHSAQASYYIDIPTATANDTLVTLGLNQTFTGTLTMPAPTITGTITGASQTLSGTLGVTGAATFTAAINANGNIVGDGATEISGIVRDVTDVGATNPFTVTIAMCGETFYNSQANQSNLPEASTAIGCKLTFVCANASNFDINPDDADVMLFAANAAGDMLRSATVGDTLTIQAIDATNWAVLSMYPAAGDWADAN